MNAMDNGNQTTEHAALPETTQTVPSQQVDSDSNKILIGVVVGAIVILALIIVGVILLLLPTTDTERVRDVFIIFMALQSLVTGLALIILIIQLANLINLLKNEVKPIMDSTNETVSNLRGTTVFLSENLVGPVIKMNEYLAGLSEFMKVVGLARRKPKTKKKEGV